MNNLQKIDAASIDALRKKGFKATPQRVAICRFAIQSREHPTAQRIYDEVKKTHPTVSLATIYKTMQILGELNLVQEIDLPNSQARFDPNMHPHINLICTNCGTIQDLNTEATSEFIQKVTATTKFAPTGQRLDIYGVCQKCSHLYKHNRIGSQ
jgi:Fur family peroxide stress response transcriptional regulator